MPVRRRKTFLSLEKSSCSLNFMGKILDLQKPKAKLPLILAGPRFQYALCIRSVYNLIPSKEIYSRQEKLQHYKMLVCTYKVN